MTLKTPLAAALVLCALIAPVQAGDVLSPNELKKLAPGRYAVSVMGLVNMTVTMRPNGAIVGEAKGKKDRGYWTVQGQKLCIAWNQWLNGSRRCATLKGDNGQYSGGGLYITRI